MDKNQKKLLILGAFAQICDIIQRAVDDGYYVIVTDNIPDSPGRKIATEDHFVSITDVRGLVDLCRRYDVNAVMNYCIHSGQLPYQQICEELKLPCYGTEKQFRTLSDKIAFREACVKYGIDIVASHKADFDYLLNLPDSDYPIVIKPADGRASKGITICNSKHQVKKALEVASDHSANDEVLVEKYMTGPEVAVKYFVSDGNIALTSMSDIHTYYHEGQRIYIGTQTFPSRSYEKFLTNADHKLRKMIKEMGIKNGPLSFSGFVDGEKFRFIDPSFRMGGAQDWLIVEKITGVNIATAMTQFALTGSMGISEKMNQIDRKIDKKSSAMLYFLVRLGTISEIRGVERASKHPCVISFHQCHHAGSEITQFGSSEHVAIRFLLVADNSTSLKSAIYEIQSQIRIIDTNGEDMLYSNFDPEILTS